MKNPRTNHPKDTDINEATYSYDENEITHPDELPTPDELFTKHEEKNISRDTQEEDSEDDFEIPGYIIKANIRHFVLTILFALALIFLFVQAFGINFYSMNSRSMQSEIPVGSLVVTRRANPMTLREGDVITFITPEEISVTHKIVEISQNSANPHDLAFTTKGTDNPAVDHAVVLPQQIQGRMLFHIPFIGGGIMWFRNLII